MRIRLIYVFVKKERVSSCYHGILYLTIEHRKMINNGGCLKLKIIFFSLFGAEVFLPPKLTRIFWNKNVKNPNSCKTTYICKMQMHLSFSTTVLSTNNESFKLCVQIQHPVL